MSQVTLPTPRPLQFLPDDFKVTTWAKLKPYYNELTKREINSIEALEKWLRDVSEIEAVVGEDFSWRYIRLSQNSEDEHASELYQYAVQELMPRISKVENKLNQKLVNSPYAEQLEKDKYFIHLRNVKNQVALFREENIPLQTQAQMKSKEYGAILSKMLIEVDGKQMTLQQAGTLLEVPDRTKREAVYFKIARCLSEDREQLDQLFDELVALRHQIARNAGFDNYRDYKFKALGRFDYDVQDCYDFHRSIATQVLPVVDKMYRHRKAQLGVETLRPWDLAVDPSGKPPLRPFETAEELTRRSIEALTRLHPSFGESLSILNEMNRLDLESRKGKHPGGYNMPLYFSGVPFIFMNAARSFTDVHVLMHETGHAIHSLLTREYELNSAKNLPSEVAELASMTMELLSMDHWDVFFKNPDDLRRAKVTQLEGVLKTLPWVATIDKFQHWIYLHPEHTRTERTKAWMEIYREFTTEVVHREGLEKYMEHQWHKQLHLYEVPFYYIEYGMAQLGAIAVWKRYREQPEQALEDYTEALKLGYTQPIGKIYERAGIAFNFEKSYVRSLANFVQGELDKVLA